MKAEDIIERYEAMPRKRKLKLALWLLVLLVVIGVGINTIASGFLGVKPKGPGGTAGKSGAVQPVTTGSIREAKFNYLSPVDDDNWTFNKDSLAYESTRGVVKYTVKRKASGMVTVSQQAMPDELKPAHTSDKFMAMVNDSKVMRSQDVGGGKVYFLPALKNGAPASGSDTVIYATDDVLLFGRASEVLSYAVWASLLEHMQITVP